MPPERSCTNDSHGRPVSPFRPDRARIRWRMQLAAVAEPLMAGDRPALAKILHAWEAANVRGTEVDPYWEPTPFPLER